MQQNANFAKRLEQQKYLNYFLLKTTIFFLKHFFVEKSE